MAPYPSRAEIHDLFLNLSNGNGAKHLQFARVADNVDWVIRGHSPMSGAYTSKVEFQAKTLGLLKRKVLTAPLAMYVDNVVGGGDQEQAAVEMHADSVCQNGLKYDMAYAWFVTFDEDGITTKVRAYVDTDLLSRAIAQNA